MRPLFSLSLVLAIAIPASAQFGKNPNMRSTTKAADTGTRKATDRTHTDRAAKAGDQGADTDLANKLLAIMDTDGDGTVTKAEMNKAMAALHKMKKDPKGNISYEKPAEDNANAAAGADPAPGAAAGAANAGPQQQEAGRFMQQYDRNGDGVLTPDELPPQLANMLRDADTNHDRRIEPAELAAFVAKMGDRMRAVNGGAAQAGAVPGDGRRQPRNDNK
jgi:Ca2+-binding EF-hand superfamily protein